MNAPHYIIASLKHTNKYHEHITFWGPNWRGYVLAITDERVGKYPEYEVREGMLNDGESCIAVPEDVVMALLAPQPFYATSKGQLLSFYDTPGPVVDNTRANWNRLIAASLPRTTKVKPKPEVFRGTRRSFGIDAGTIANLARQAQSQLSVNAEGTPASSEPDEQSPVSRSSLPNRSVLPREPL